MYINNMKDAFAFLRFTNPFSFFTGTAAFLNAPASETSPDFTTRVWIRRLRNSFPKSKKRL